MSKMVQIRNVPDGVHRKLKVRAVEAGLSLSDYLNREVARLAETPTLEEMLQRLSRREPIQSPEPLEDLVRAERDSH